MHLDIKNIVGFCICKNRYTQYHNESSLFLKYKLEMFAAQSNDNTYVPSFVKFCPVVFRGVALSCFVTDKQTSEKPHVSPQKWRET